MLNEKQKYITISEHIKNSIKVLYIFNYIILALRY